MLYAVPALQNTPPERTTEWTVFKLSVMWDGYSESVSVAVAGFQSLRVQLCLDTAFRLFGLRRRDSTARLDHVTRSTQTHCSLICSFWTVSLILSFRMKVCFFIKQPTRHTESSVRRITTVALMATMMMMMMMMMLGPAQSVSVVFIHFFIFPFLSLHLILMDHHQQHHP